MKRLTKYGTKKASIDTITDNAFYGCEYGPIERSTEVRLSREEVIRRLKKLQRLEKSL